jgi:hypothetical protein
MAGLLGWRKASLLSGFRKHVKWLGLIDMIDGNRP